MKTELFENITTNELLTFEEAKEQYLNENDIDLPLIDGATYLILMKKIIKNSNKYKVIENEVLEWCNRYAAYNEADRYLSQGERDYSIKNIYECILTKIESMIDTLKENLSGNDRETVELLEQLNNLL